MTRFSFKNGEDSHAQHRGIEDGVHSAVIVQVADIGLQKPFDPDEPPEQKMAVAFELEPGALIAKRFKLSAHPLSVCYSLFAAAFPGLEGEFELGDLLGKTVLIEVELRNGTWPRVIQIMPLEEGFEPVTPSSELLSFDVAEMDKAAYLKLHRDIRSWVSRRVRHAPGADASEGTDGSLDDE